MNEPQNVYQLAERLAERYPDDTDMRALADLVQQAAGVRGNIDNALEAIRANHPMTAAQILGWSQTQMKYFEGEVD